MNGVANNPASPARPTASRLDLEGVVALLTPAAAAIALFVASGALDRIQREASVALVIAVALVLAAGVLLAMASFMNGAGQPDESGRRVRGLFAAGLAAAVVGLVLVGILAISNAPEASRPQIMAALNEDGTKLNATISASEVPADSGLSVHVDLQTITEGKGIDNPSPFDDRGSLPMERAFVGSDADGDVVHAISVPVLRGGSYTHVVVEATTGDDAEGKHCIDLPSPTSPDDQTACTFIPLYEQ